MSWLNNLDRQTRSLLLQEAAAKQQAASNKPVVDPLITERISYINNRAPWIPANTQLSLAKSYASDQAVDKAAELYVRNMNDNPASVGQLSGATLQYLLSKKVNEAVKKVANGESVDKSFFEEEKDPGNIIPDFASGIKQASRLLGSISLAAPELIQTGFSLATLGTKEGRERSYSLKDSLESFSLFQLLSNWDEQGDGFFLTEELQAQQSEAARKTRGMVNGSAFTIGRGAAATLHLPENSRWYTGVSGFLDFMVQIATPEPVKYLYKGSKVAAQVGRNLGKFKEADGSFLEKTKEVVDFSTGVVPSITKADAKSYREALSADAGLGRSIAGLSLDVQKWDRFMSTNTTAVKALQELASESDELAIAEKFQWRLSPESIQRLAKANTPTKVKAELVGPYAIGANTLSTKIQDIQTGLSSTPYRFVVEKSPLKHSRLLTQLPDAQLVINGTEADRIKAVKNMHLSLKTAGATPETLRRFTKEALDKFKSTSSSDDQRDAYNLYKSYVKETLQLNGVKDEVIQALFQRTKKSRDDLRKFMVDRMGQETDLGFMKVHADMLRKHLPESVWSEFIEKAAQSGDTAMGFARPMQLSQLFDRVQSLPDPRELKRLTSNPFFREVLTENFNVKNKILKPFVSKKTSMEITEYADRPLYDSIQDQLNAMPKRGTGDPILEAERIRLERQQNALVKTVQKKVYSGEQKMPQAILDAFQNAIWKPLNLATIGYIMRNSMDAQLRMAIGGKTGFFSHPGEYISLLLGETRSANKLLTLAKKYDLSTKERSILGEQLTVRGPKLLGKNKAEQNTEIAEEFARLRAEHADLLQLSMRKQGLNQSRGLLHTRYQNDWRTISKTDGDRPYSEAVLDTLRLVNEDDLQRVAAQGLVFNIPEEELFDQLASIASQADNYRQINGVYSRGIGFRAVEGNTVQGPKVNLDALDKPARREWLREHAKNLSYANVKHITGNVRDVTFIAAFDRVPFGDAISFPKNSLNLKYTNEELKLGSFVELYMDGGKMLVLPRSGKVRGKKIDPRVRYDGVVTSLDDATATVVPAYKGTATGKETRKYSPEAVRMISRQAVDAGDGVGLNPVYAAQVKTTDPGGKNWFEAAQRGMDSFTNLFFQELYAQKWVKTLERSPVFRKFYYEEISNQIGRLGTSEAQVLITKLETSAAKAGFGDDIGKYIGSPGTAQKLKQVASTPGNGTLKASDLDDYARLVGITKTKELLYDASEKNNLEDSLRIIFPFVGAWREIAGRYISFMIEDPGRLARTARYTNIMSTPDTDGDGRGFIYEDPQSGEPYFKFPEIFGLPAALRLAGVKSFFEAPVAQLSQGMNWIPGLGPLAQIPMSYIFRNTPDTNNLLQILLPYGKVELGLKGTMGQFNPVPGTLSKTASLAYATLVDSSDIERNVTFANTLKDVVRAKYASGDYDLTTEEGFKELESDSVRDAQIISAIRILQQFVGPTSPQIGYQIEVQDKDIYVDEIVKIFSKMQQEDYDSSVPRFLKIFGKEAALYVGAKSRPLTPGLEATPEFGEWEMKNRDLIDEYPEVAAYFAPQGSEFSFDVYRRQSQEGSREKLSVREMVDLAQNRIGSAQFSAARRMFGAFPTDAEREKLAIYRAKLSAEHPGFKPVAEFTVGRRANQLIELRNIINDPRLANNEVVPYVKRYLASRDSLLAREGIKGFDSFIGQSLAETLYSFGNGLARESLEFDRIWQRLLSSEVEQ